MAATTQQYVSGQFAKGIKKKIADSNGTPQGKQKALSDELDAEIEQQITLFNEVNQAQQITAQSILVKKVKEAGSEKTAIAESIAATIAATIAGPPIAGALLTPRQKSILANIATLTVHKNLLNDLVIPEGNTVEKAQEALINLGELREQIAHNEEESKTLSGKFQEEINRQKSSLTSTAGTTINQAYVDHIQATIAILEAEQKKIPSFQTSETDIVKLSAEIKGKVILRKALEKKLKDMQAQFPDRESKEEARYQNRINTPVNTAGLDAMTGPTAMASPTLDALKTLKANIDEVNKQREELAALEKIRPFIKNDKSTQSTQFQKECFAKLCELDKANAIVAHQLRDKAAGALIMSAMNEAEQQKLFSEQRLLDIAIRNRLKKEAITPEQKDEAKQSAKREASPASGHYSGSLTVEALGKEYGFSSLIKDPNTKEFKEQTLCGSDGKTPIKLDHETLMKL
ncbi:MAG: hypothetical protein NTU49_08835, partial [Gammaproteobacteria bacterium]|nr:hypothetical protein [Gammaproteobacteria bacterium]